MKADFLLFLDHHQHHHHRGRRPYDAPEGEDLESLIKYNSVPGPIGGGGTLCRLCGKVLKNHVKRHFQDIHMNSPGYTCPACNGIYRTKNTFGVHILRKHPQLRGFDLNQFANN